MTREGKKRGDSSETAKFGGEGKEKKNGQKADEIKVKRRVWREAANRGSKLNTFAIDKKIVLYLFVYKTWKSLTKYRHSS